MNIQYRIVKVDPESHGVVIRYFTDLVTEMDLASSFNEDGSVKLNADGYPVSTRTDVLMSIYDTPTPSAEEIEKRIKLNAPVDWLKLQEDITNPEIDTRMRELRNFVGDSKSFTLEDIQGIKNTMMADAAAARAESNSEVPEEVSLLKAYDTVTNMIDSIKVLSEKDPSFLQELSELLKR
jgi:hypothetical protein